MQTPDAAPVVQPHAGGPGGRAAKGANTMFAKENETNVTSSAHEPARQSAGAEDRPDRQGREEDEPVITAERGAGAVRGSARVGAVNPELEAVSMDSNATVETVGAANHMTRAEAAQEIHRGQTMQKEDGMAGQKTVYKFHFNPTSEIGGATAAELADSAEEVAAYLAALAAEPQIEAEPDGNQGMIYRTTNRRVAARFQFPEMWTDEAEKPLDPAYTDEEWRATDALTGESPEYRTWSCRAEFSVDLAEILLRLHNHPRFGALLGYRAHKMRGAPMLEITTTLTRDEILEAFASTFDTHVMAQSLRPVPLEENDGERDYDVDFPETHCRLPRPGRFCLMNRFIQDYPFFAFDESHSARGITTTLRRAEPTEETR